MDRQPERPVGPPSIPPSNPAMQTQPRPSHPALFLIRHRIPGFRRLLPRLEQSVHDEESQGKRRSPADSLHTIRRSTLLRQSLESQRNFRSVKSRPPPPQTVAGSFSLRLYFLELDQTAKSQGGTPDERPW